MQEENVHRSFRRFKIIWTVSESLCLNPLQMILLLWLSIRFCLAVYDAAFMIFTTTTTKVK